MFDMGERLGELRCRPTSWLVARRDELVREQRRLRVEELAVTRVLDERGALDESLAGRDGVSCRAVRETVETARALESLPHVAAAAHAGELSSEQLGAVAQLAEEESDREWARRAPNVSPGDLARLVRTQHKPTIEDSRKRRDARYLRMWWRKDTGMLGFAGELPDLDGARLEKTINKMIDRMQPPKGHPGTPENTGVPTRSSSSVATSKAWRSTPPPRRHHSWWSKSPNRVPPPSRGSPCPTRWSSHYARKPASRRSSSTTAAWP
jgi:hypothetical protein